MTGDGPTAAGFHGYSYNANNRMIQVDPGATPAAYTYNASWEGAGGGGGGDGLGAGSPGGDGSNTYYYYQWAPAVSGSFNGSAMRSLCHTRPDAGSLRA